MKLVDYTGKLNNHNEYLKVIKQLEKKSKYMEYALIDKDDMNLINNFENLIISVKSKKSWCGTTSKSKTKVYKLKAEKEIFEYLIQFETFCKFNNNGNEDMVQYTDFGINDIAFFDDSEMPLFFTVTHEGYLTSRDDLFV